MVLHPCIDSIAKRYAGLDEQIRNGKLDLAGAVGRYAWVQKDNSLGMATLNAADPNSANINEHAIPFCISRQIEDRDGDVCVSLGVQLEEYAVNPIIFFGHQQIPLPIAKSTAPDGRLCVFPEENRIMAIAFFDEHDEEAMAIEDKIRRGYLSGASIAFVPISAVRRNREEEKGLYDRSHPHSEPTAPPGYLFKVFSLTEWSVVGVPSCAAAVALRDVVDKEKAFLTPRLQKALLPYCAASQKEQGRCWTGWCPTPSGCVPCETKEKAKNPSLPDTGVSGATTGAHYLTYSGRLADKLAELIRQHSPGKPIPEGILTTQRVQTRFNLGIRPEDAAAEIFHDLVLPRLTSTQHDWQEDARNASRNAPRRNGKSAKEQPMPAKSCSCGKPCGCKKATKGLKSSLVEANKHKSSKADLGQLKPGDLVNGTGAWEGLTGTVQNISSTGRAVSVLWNDGIVRQVSRAELEPVKKQLKAPTPAANDVASRIGNNGIVFSVDVGDKLIIIQPKTMAATSLCRTAAQQTENKFPGWNVMVRDAMRTDANKSMRKAKDSSGRDIQVGSTVEVEHAEGRFAMGKVVMVAGNEVSVKNEQNGKVATFASGSVTVKKLVSKNAPTITISDQKFAGKKYEMERLIRGAGFKSGVIMWDGDELSARQSADWGDHGDIVVATWQGYDRSKQLLESSGTAGGYTVGVGEFGDGAGGFPADDATDTAGDELCQQCGGTGNCPACEGTGEKDGVACEACGGSGACSMCSGVGKVTKAVAKASLGTWIGTVAHILAGALVMSPSMISDALESHRVSAELDEMMRQGVTPEEAARRIKPKIGKSLKGADMKKQPAKRKIAAPKKATRQKAYEVRQGMSVVGTYSSLESAKADADQRFREHPASAGKVYVAEATSGQTVYTPSKSLRNKALDDPGSMDGAGAEMTNEGNPEELKGIDDPNVEPFTAKPSALEGAKAYSHLKELRDYFGEGGEGDLAKMDHPGMSESLKALVDDEGPLSKAMQHVKDAVIEHHGDGGDPDEFMSKCMKALGGADEFQPGEAGMVDNGDIPPMVEESVDEMGGTEDINDESKSEIGSEEWAAEEAEEPEHQDDPDTEEILERYQHPKSRKWLTRTVGTARRAKDGRVYVVRKALDNAGNEAELTPGTSPDLAGADISGATLTKSAETLDSIGKAADHLETAADHPETPPMHKSAHAFHAKALRKALDDMGTEEVKSVDDMGGTEDVVHRSITPKVEQSFNGVRQMRTNLNKTLERLGIGRSN